MVPGNFGCGSAVFAATIMFAPSRAAFNAIALPIPREAPVMKIVRPANFLPNKKKEILTCDLIIKTCIIKTLFPLKT